MSKMQRCITCKKTLPDTAFHKNGNRKNGLTNKCRQCVRAYDLKRYRKSGNFKDRCSQTAKANWDAFRSLTKWVRSQIPCGNCEKFFTKEIMQFNHYEIQGPNRTPWSTHLPQAIKQLTETQLLCANCHALCTAQQRECKWRLPNAA